MGGASFPRALKSVEVGGGRAKTRMARNPEEIGQDDMGDLSLQQPQPLESVECIIGSNLSESEGENTESDDDDEDDNVGDDACSDSNDKTDQGAGGEGVRKTYRSFRNVERDCEGPTVVVTSLSRISLPGIRFVVVKEAAVVHKYYALEEVPAAVDTLRGLP